MIEYRVLGTEYLYIELHARSAFSFLEGASLPEELAAVCSQLKLPAMALLDTDGVYGAPRFHLAAKKMEIKAHIGAEVSANLFSPQRRMVTEKDISHRSSRILTDSINNQKSPIKNSSVSLSLRGEFRLPLLVSSRAGYQNLCRLITKMKLRAKKGEGAVTEDELQEHASGLICLTGGAEGPLAAALQHGGIDEALRQVDQLVGIFGPGNVYVELQRHFQREEESRNRAAIDIARSLNLPLLATNGVCYATPKARELCDAFTAIRNHRTLSTAGRLLSRNSERFLKSAQEMQQLFADLPEAIANTLELSSRLEFTLNDLGYEFPRYPVPEGETMNSFLRERAWEGFRQRYGRATPDMQTRARRQIETRTDAHRKTQTRRLLPHRLGHGPLLPRAKHSGAGTRIRRQQRRLLLARHHRGRCRQHGTCSSSVFFPKSAASGPTSISTCPAATSAKKSSSTSTSVTASAAPP